MMCSLFHHHRTSKSAQNVYRLGYSISRTSYLRGSQEIRSTSSVPALVEGPLCWSVGVRVGVHSFFV